MELAIVGSGYVGLVTGACLSDSGNGVTCVDISKERINELKEGRCPIYEPGLGELLQKGARAGRLKFTTDLGEAVSKSRIVFVAVGTPPRQDGGADLSNVEAVCRSVAKLMDGPRIIAIKSTVPVGTGRRMESLMSGETSHKATLVSNPEFLKEGSALDDFFRPDRIVIGSNDPEAAQLMSEIHAPFVRNQNPIVTMSREAAEMTKYASNAFLATRISFINEIASICEANEVDINEVRTGMGYDSRIGFHFLYPGAGYGGSCFPKDVQALSQVAAKAGLQADILETVHQVNQRQKMWLFHRITGRFGRTLDGRKFALWGISFKPNTDDIREAPSLTVIENLLESGAQVSAHDPRATKNLKEVFGDRLDYRSNAYETLDGADALVIATEWNEYRTPDFDILKKKLKQPVIFDGRNLYDLATIRREGFEYYSVGRPALKPREE
jgi:UDPglucose 6-dehydrogenase